MKPNSAATHPSTTAQKKRKPSDRATKSGRFKLPIPPGDETAPAAHEGATDEEVGDRGGPGPGYDDEPEKVKDEGGVS